LSALKPETTRTFGADVKRALRQRGIDGRAKRQGDRLRVEFSEVADLNVVYDIVMNVIYDYEDLLTIYHISWIQIKTLQTESHGPFVRPEAPVIPAHDAEAID
jgi:hypothetical protein